MSDAVIRIEGLEPLLRKLEKLGKITPNSVGTGRGWDHPGWRENFYPDDMPTDWRLAYFANNFPAVLLPAGLLADLDAATIRDWVSAIEGDFVFYLETDTSSDKLQAFAGRLAGICPLLSHLMLRDVAVGDLIGG